MGTGSVQLLPRNCGEMLRQGACPLFQRCPHFQWTIRWSVDKKGQALSE